MKNTRRTCRVAGEAVTDVIARLPAADVPSHGFAVRVDREELVIPYRIHAEDVDTASVDGLAGIRSDVLACLYTGTTTDMCGSDLCSDHRADASLGRIVRGAVDRRVRR